MIEIDNLSLDEWYTCLKPYQKNAIEILVAKYGEEKAAEVWITARGPIQTATFGGSQNQNEKTLNYWNRLKDEFDKLICGHPDYEKERDKFTVAGESIGLSGASALTAIIAPLIGVSTVLLLPAIVLLLHVAAKMGIKAYCVDKKFEEVVKCE